MDYYFENKEFVIRDYNAKPPFSSFLPGVCGVGGVPLWCCYVNRGQAVASFGADRRDGAIMEFSPAVHAYEDTARKGFRTFIRTHNAFYEPFSPAHKGRSEQTFHIAPNHISLVETASKIGLETHVDYFLLPQQRVGALVRRVTLKNITQQPLEAEVLDGMARVLPYGVRNSQFREMANLMRSFFAAQKTDSGTVLFSLRASAENDARVNEVTRAHFCFAAMEGKPLPLLCDSEAVFGADTGYDRPGVFCAKGLKILDSEAAVWNKVPCAFAAARIMLAPMESKTLYFIAGITNNASELQECTASFCSSFWMAEKLAQADQLTCALTASIETHTSAPIFDLYLRQSWLDNVLRGGVPFVLGDKILHLYSRRHGDLERDYNNFSLSDTHLCEGDGNFRDVCQNRRNDVLFFPAVGEREIVQFAELLQLDGYNPLELSAVQWRLLPSKESELFALCKRFFQNETAAAVLLPALCEGISVGACWRILDSNGFSLSEENELCFFTALSALCTEVPCAAFSDGYWIDHWTYVPELIDAYLKIFPDKLHALMFDSSLRFFKAAAWVRPLRQKMQSAKQGVRQYDAVKMLSQSGGNPWENLRGGQTLTASLFAKLFLICVLKCATLDPEQRGLEMEAGKPGWNDALNGLPGLFGSSISECVDLVLLARQLLAWARSQKTIIFPRAVWKLSESVKVLAEALNEGHCSRFDFWRQSLALRENWRAQAYHGFCAADWEDAAQKGSDTVQTLQCLVQLLTRAIPDKDVHGVLPPTYYTYEPVFKGDAAKFEELESFRARALPPFLEGPAKLLRLRRAQAAQTLYRAIRESELYDDKLAMYKTCVSLESESFEIGRIRAFTPGWFERENIFLHAEYKFLLALLRSGLTDEFFSEAKHLLIPFLNPEQYARSTAENVSFLCSSANPDPTLCGRGYMARLSGATAEVISMWVEMFLGSELFSFHNEELTFSISPKLAGWLFDETGTVSFYYLGCRFEYHNPSRSDTWKKEISIASLSADGMVVAGNSLPAPLAVKLREGRLSSLHAYFGVAPS